MKIRNRTFAVVMAALLVVQLFAPTLHAHLSNAPNAHKTFQAHLHLGQHNTSKTDSARAEYPDHKDSDHSRNDVIVVAHDAVMLKNLSVPVVKKIVGDITLVSFVEPVYSPTASRAPPVLEPPAHFPKSFLSYGFYALAPPLV